MAKKSRRARRTQAAKPSITANPVSQGQVVSNTPARKTVDFTQDYHYVYADVRTLVAITLFMIVVMFGLSYAF